MKSKILISTGGSGGHVLPAITIYDHLKSNYETLISTDLRGLKYLDKKNYKYIIVNTPKLNNLLLFPFSFLKVIILTLKSLIILKKENISESMEFTRESLSAFGNKSAINESAPVITTSSSCSTGFILLSIQ